MCFSASIIIDTSSRNLTLGSQPSFSFALVASPNNSDTSEGLKYFSSTDTRSFPVALSYPFSSIPSPFHSRS